MLRIVKSYTAIEQLAELSIAVLLFLVGMKLDLNKINCCKSRNTAAICSVIMFLKYLEFH